MTILLTHIAESLQDTPKIIATLASQLRCRAHYNIPPHRSPPCFNTPRCNCLEYHHIPCSLRARHVHSILRQFFPTLQHHADQTGIPHETCTTSLHNTLSNIAAPIGPSRREAAVAVIPPHIQQRLELQARSVSTAPTPSHSAL